MFVIIVIYLCVNVVIYLWINVVIYLCVNIVIYLCASIVIYHINVSSSTPPPVVMIYHLTKLKSDINMCVVIVWFVCV